MTTMTFQSRPVHRRRVRPKTGRTQVSAIDIIAALDLGFRPVVVSVAILVAAVTWAAPAHADAADDSLPTASPFASADSPVAVGFWSW
jgi:hypothetical protein